MKGLLLNGFYSAVGNIKLFLLIVLITGATLIATGNPTAQESFIYITITALSVNAVVSSRKDAISKWNKFEITMPVRRRDIVACKYSSYMLWVLAGTLLALVVTAVATLIHKNSNLPLGTANLYSTFTLGIGISFLTGALFYPFSYLVGIEKSETVLIISILAAIGLTIAALHILNQFIASFAARMVMFIIFFLSAFAISYILTLSMYLKKEF